MTTKGKGVTRGVTSGARRGVRTGLRRTGTRGVRRGDVGSKDAPQQHPTMRMGSLHVATRERGQGG